MEVELPRGGCSQLSYIEVACIVLGIITHCVDDVCGIEMDESVSSSRHAFLHFVYLGRPSSRHAEVVGAYCGFTFLGLASSLIMSA